MTQFNSDYYASQDPPLIRACNGRSYPYNHVAGISSQTSHSIELVSSPMTNIVKVSFLEEAGSGDGYHLDYLQAYDPTQSKTGSFVGFADNYTNPKYTIKQLNRLGEVVGVGQCVRWVAGDITNKSEGYIKVTSASDFVSSGADAGIMFQTDGVGFSTAWGSSIKSISLLRNVYKFEVPAENTLTSETTTESVSLGIPNNYGDIPGTGLLTEVAIRRINTTGDPAGVEVATGYIFSLTTQNTDSPASFPVVHILEGTANVPYQTTSGTTGERVIDVSDYDNPTLVYLIEAAKKDTSGNPCFRYRIVSSMRFDVGSNELTFKRIEFTENGTNPAFPQIDVTLSVNTVFQYAWDQITETTAPSIDAIPYAFVQEQSALYIDECDNTKPFMRMYGGVYQYNSNTSAHVAWGNRSYTSDTKFSERKRGRFVNIKHSLTNLYAPNLDYNANWEIGGELLVQTLSRTIEYDSNSNYTPGEKIFQIRSSADYDYASATVISWSYPDLTKSTRAPMILVGRIDKTGPAQPGAYIDVNLFQDLQQFRVGGLPDIPVGDFVYAGKILPYSKLSLTDTAGDDWPYEVTGANVYFSDRKSTDGKFDESPLSVTVGTTRIRCVSLGPTPSELETSDSLYKYYLFDTQMTENNSIFGDVTDIIYDDGANAAKTIINIAPYSGRKEIQETFSGTNQTITTRKTTIYDPSKDKLFFRIPIGQIFENVLSNGSMTVELQKIFTHTFSNPAEITWIVGANDIFLAGEPNINWFAVNSDTGNTFNLVDGTSPSYASNQLGFQVDESGSMTIYAPIGLASEIANIVLFAKTQRTFDISNVRKKVLKTATETITGFVLGTSKSTNKQYYMELMKPDSLGSIGMKPGQISTIVSVYAINSTNGKIVTGGENIISSFMLDTGATDQKIGRPKLILGSGYVQSSGTDVDGNLFGSVTDPAQITLKITYEYYEFDTTESNISVRESYVDIEDEIVSNSEIPFYFSQNSGNIIHESAIIDFRPNTLTLTDDFYMGSSKIIPHPDWVDQISTSYYLPRRDKLILTRDGKFEILYGKPSLSPKYPSDIPNSMSLYLLEKDPFVFGPSSIKTKMIDNRRYTMRDIGKIEKRVQKLEYYTTLSILEKKAQDMLVLDANGNDRFKNGILVDTFEGHKIGDVTNRDYNVAIDFTNRYARPPFKTHNNNFIRNNDGSTTFASLATQKNGKYTDLYMFPYTQVVFVAQPLATRAITVQPHDTIQYEGVVSMLPSIDTWVSTTRRPDVNVNLAGENDAWNQMVSAFNNNNLAPFGTQWGEWETLSRVGTRTVIDSETTTGVIQDWHLVQPGHAHGGSGVGRDERTINNITTNTLLVNEQLEQARNGITRTLSTSTTDISLGDRVVDVRLIPYMREKNIKIVANGMKPRTRVYVFFDGVSVEEYCYKYSSINDLYGTTAPPGSQDFPGSELTLGVNGIHFATGSSEDLKTDENGNIYIEFRVPDGMFRVGDRKFEITSDSRNNASRASTYGSAIYSASGLRTEVEETIATTRSFQISDPIESAGTRTTNLSGIITETTSNTVVQTRNNDPLAQTFFVDANEHPEGIFLSSVDLFFARKPEDSTMLPVQIQIRPVVNGYPDSSKIYPGAKVVKMPSEITVSEDASIKTTFTFDYPVHLPPGEHSLVVKGDTSEYEIYIATLGDYILGTETKVTNQPYVGVFFTSANASTWTAEQNTDMMMILNKCEFTANTSYQLVLRSENIEVENQFELFNINSRYFDFNSCRASWSVNISSASGGGNSTIFVEPNTDVELTGSYSYGTRKGSTNTDVPFNLTITSLTTNKDVSPVIDLQSLSLFAVNNLVERNSSSNNGELEPFVPISVGTPRARYISRVVTLVDGFDSNNMKVTLSVNKPIGTNVQVFVKTQDSESTDDFHSFGYTRLVSNVPNFDTYYTEGANEFREIEFSLPEDTATPYNRFCVKVCLYSDQPWNVAKIRDLRAVTVL